MKINVSVGRFVVGSNLGSRALNKLLFVAVVFLMVIGSFNAVTYGKPQENGYRHKQFFQKSKCYWNNRRAFELLCSDLRPIEIYRMKQALEKEFEACLKQDSSSPEYQVKKVIAKINDFDVKYKQIDNVFYIYFLRALLKQWYKDKLILLSDSIEKENKKTFYLKLTSAVIEAKCNKNKQALVSLLSNALNDKRISVSQKICLLLELTYEYRIMHGVDELALPVLCVMSEYCSTDPKVIPCSLLSHFCVTPEGMINNELMKDQSFAKMLSSLINYCIQNIPKNSRHHRVHLALLQLVLEMEDEELQKTFYDNFESLLVTYPATYIMVACYDNPDVALDLFKKHWSKINLNKEFKYSPFGLTRQEIIECERRDFDDPDLFFLARKFFSSAVKVSKKHSIYKGNPAITQLSRNSQLSYGQDKELIKHKFTNPDIHMRCFLLMRISGLLDEMAATIPESYFFCEKHKKVLFSQNEDMFENYSLYARGRLQNGDVKFGMQALYKMIQHYLHTDNPSYKISNGIKSIIMMFEHLARYGYMKKITKTSNDDFKDIFKITEEFRESRSNASCKKDVLQLEFILHYMFHDDKKAYAWFESVILPCKRRIQDVGKAFKLLALVEVFNESCPEQKKDPLTFTSSKMYKKLHEVSINPDYFSRCADDFFSEMLEKQRRIKHYKIHLKNRAAWKARNNIKW